MSETTKEIDPVDEADDVAPIPVLEVAPKAGKPKYMVIGNTFYAQTADGELTIPLAFKTKLLRKLRSTEAVDEIDQVFILLDGLGDKKTAEALDELDVFETTAFVSKFFQAWEEKNKASLGEAQRSSS